MENVYSLVETFYQGQEEEGLLPQEWVEGFLRHKAWQGESDLALQQSWVQLRWFLLYLYHADLTELDDLSSHDFSMALRWLTSQPKGIKAEIKAVRRFFSLLKEFFAYAQLRQWLTYPAALDEAAEKVAGGNKLRFLQISDILDELTFPSAEIEERLLSPDDLGRLIAEALEVLMIKIGNFFQKDAFTDDFDRALYLYTGPFDALPDDQEEEFWLGFWDYFIFDYHLLNDDLTPLQRFRDEYKDKLTADEDQILQDLLSSKFTVFYVERSLDGEMVECKNLFSEERFELPMPEVPINQVKKQLFFGHVFARGMLMINYVTNLEVSVTLRRRIKDEVIKLAGIFARQKPGNDLPEFLKRHALVIRHAINALTSMARVTVTRAVTDEEFVKAGLKEFSEKREGDSVVSALLLARSFEYGFSRHDMNLLLSMWQDFCGQYDRTILHPESWAAAVICAYAQINGLSHFVVSELADDFAAAPGQVYRNRMRLAQKLGLRAFDPRYLGEEGFILSLFV